MLYPVTYVVTLVIFAAIDSVWLGTMASRIYRPLLGDLLIDGFRPVPAIVFYLLYAAGLVWFAVLPALRSGETATGVFVTGALLGLFAYGTYDLTNYATMRGWGTTITVIDMAWGTLLSGATALLAVLAVRLIGRWTGMAI